MRDYDIRTALWDRLESEHRDEPNTLMLDEFSLWHGATRIDLAVINGEIQGYELKSERDTLERLPAQAEIYSSVLDRVTLVAAEKHIENAKKIVPEWWGIATACNTRSSVEILVLRNASANPDIDPEAVAALVWRDEALAELERHGNARGVRGKSRDAVYQRLAQTMSLDDLRGFVRATLKARRSWRADRRQTQCGD